jgi:hypothetical protein
MNRIRSGIAALVAVALVAIGGCKSNPVIGAGPQIVATTLTLRTLAGVQATQFHTGEKFEMRFSLTNLTRSSVCYSYTPPETVFRIYRGDSLIVTSVEGMQFPQVIQTDCVGSGEAISRSWADAPATALRSNLVLDPGTYTAAVSHASYLAFGVQPASAVTFTIIP